MAEDARVTATGTKSPSAVRLLSGPATLRV